MFEIVGKQPQEKADNTIVRIDYGPYEAHGLITYRIQRLRGLIDKLTELGIKFEIRKINLFNRLEINMFERTIFRCDIRNLKFNMISEYDPVCQRVVEVIQEAAFRMNNQRVTDKNPPDEPEDEEKVEKVEEKATINDEANVLTIDSYAVIPVEPDHVHEDFKESL